MICSVKDIKANNQHILNTAIMFCHYTMGKSDENNTEKNLQIFTFVDWCIKIHMELSGVTLDMGKSTHFLVSKERQRQRQNICCKAQLKTFIGIRWYLCTRNKTSQNALNHSPHGLNWFSTIGDFYGRGWAEQKGICMVTIPTFMLYYRLTENTVHSTTQCFAFFSHSHFKRSTEDVAHLSLPMQSTWAVIKIGWGE